MINRIKIRYSRSIWITAIILLLLNGVSALAAGYAFMADPSGKTLGMTTAYLRHSPFNNFFIPGITLFLILGLMSVIISVIALSRGILYHLLISLEGAALLVWIVAQIAFLGFLHPLHFVMGAVSIVLILSEFFLKDFKK